MSKGKGNLSEFTTKIIDAKQRLGFSITDIHEATQISRPYISNILNGTIPKDNMISRLCTILDLDYLEMLLLAKKAKIENPVVLEMFEEITKDTPKASRPLHSQILDQLVSIYDKFANNEQTRNEMIRRIARSIETPESTVEVARVPSDTETEHTTIPLAQQKVSAGNGHLIIETEKTYDLAFRRDWLAKRGGTYKKVVLPVTGDSMEPIIAHGDVVLVDQSEDGKVIRNGQIYIVNDPDNGVFVKQVYQEKTGLQLISYNKAYPPCFLPVPEGAVSPIIGRVIWWAHAVDPD